MTHRVIFGYTCGKYEAIWSSRREVIKRTRKNSPDQVDLFKIPSKFRILKFTKNANS